MSYQSKNFYTYEQKQDLPHASKRGAFFYSKMYNIVYFTINMYNIHMYNVEVLF
jgi:hypothetical protein